MIIKISGWIRCTFPLRLVLQRIQLVFIKYYASLGIVLGTTLDFFAKSWREVGHLLHRFLDFLHNGHSINDNNIIAVFWKQDVLNPNTFTFVTIKVKLSSIAHTRMFHRLRFNDIMKLNSSVGTRSEPSLLKIDWGTSKKIIQAETKAPLKESVTILTFTEIWRHFWMKIACCLSIGSKAKFLSQFLKILGNQP